MIKEGKGAVYDKDIQKLSKIKYRNSLRDAIYELADELSDH